MYIIPSALILGAVSLWTANAKDSGTNVLLLNDNESAIRLNWVHPDTGERYLILESMFSKQAKKVSSYLSHTFEIEEMGACESDSSCRTTSFRVSRTPEQYFVVDQNFQVNEQFFDIRNHSKELDALIEDEEMQKDISLVDRAAMCRKAAKESLEHMIDVDENVQSEVYAQLSECLKNNMAVAINQGERNVDFELTLRREIADKMENFTCSDPQLESSPDVDLREWTSEKDGITRTVHVKLDRPTSRIHVVERFASVDECEAMEQTASSKLQRATTADGKGGSHLSENRKAMQASITPDWSKESEGDLIAQLSRRIYDYVNHVLGTSIDEQGQEPLMSIQYFGTGYNETKPDRYTPHCDGPCDGDPFMDGSRMATMVIYCSIPSSGGHTNFQNANVHVQPEVGSGLFFSYFDPETNVTDKHLTQHSGCPVYEGSKKIITQWVRYGVGKKRPHSAFNTLGILHKESGE